MSRLAKTFQSLSLSGRKALIPFVTAGQSLSLSGRKALIPFVTAGDPVPDFTVPLLHAMVAAGVDVIELGVPFSDPMADGPVIQKASERALEQGMNLTRVLSMVAEFRKTDDTTPIVLMGYLNPIEFMGYADFAQAAARVGVDGVLTVDMPPEEAEEYAPLLKAVNIDPIFLLAPNSTEERIKKMAAKGSGYIYYVSLKGVTGAGHLDVDDVKKKMAQIQQLTDLPIGVGFGVKNAETAKAVASVADGVVVGSAIINKIQANLDNLGLAQQEVVTLLSSMRQAMDNEVN